MKKLFQLALPWLLCAIGGEFSAALGAETTAFTYQGSLASGGAPASGNFDFTFTVYDALTNGDVLGGPLTNAAVGVTNGAFMVTLDFGADVFTGSNVWLEIAVRTNGGASFATLAPRQPILPEPYALYAPKAGAAATATQASSVVAGIALTNAVLTNAIIANSVFAGNGGGLTNVPGTTLWQTVSGTQQTAAPNQAYLLTNNAPDFVLLPTNANVGSVVTVSGTGSNGWNVAISINQNSPVLNWTQGNAPSLLFWQAAASSSDGSHLAAVTGDGGVQLYTSTDFGANWTGQSGAPTGRFYGLVMSSDGSRLAAVTGNGLGVYTSTDFGTNWAGQPNAPSEPWLALASSSDCSHLVAAAANDHIFTSTDFGTNWTAQPNAPSEYFQSLASSADGSHLVAVVFGGGIYTSTDFGTNWTEQIAPTENWYSIASSADGSHLVAVVFGGGIYTSSDFGTNWEDQGGAPTENWTAAASSTDGSHLVAAGGNSPVYVSTDSGVSWTAQNGVPSTANWQGVASSSNGSYLVAVDGNGQIYAGSKMAPVDAGMAGTTAQFQYLGNGVWQPLSASASLLAGTASNVVPGIQITNATLTGSTVVDAQVTVLSGLRLANSQIWFRAGADQYHGLGYYGSSTSNFAGVNVDGPVLFGYSGGALGSTGGSLNNIALQWDNNQNVYIANTTYANNIYASNSLYGATISGNGSGLTSVNALIASNVVSGLVMTNPTLANAIFTNTTFAGNGSGLTNVPGTTLWQTVSNSSQSAAANQAYLFTNNALDTLTLPSSANVGGLVTVSGVGSGGWQVSLPEASLNWGLTGAPTQTTSVPGGFNWLSIASSSDGSHLVAAAEVETEDGNFGVVYTSVNFGASWAEVALGLPVSGFEDFVASSADGSHLVALATGGGIYTSINFGNNWAEQTAGLPATANWDSAACSSDGSHLVALVESGGIYTSTNFGSNWSQQVSGLPASAVWISVASSSDGSHLAAVAAGGGIYTSINFGANWAQQTSGLPANASWFSIASSSNGMNLVAAVNGGQIYTSANFGTNWTLQAIGLPSSAAWYSVASSADGSRLVAAVENGGIYTSINFGSNWAKQTAGLPASAAWSSVASSADGSHLFAAMGAGEQPGGIYSASFPNYAGVAGTTAQFQYIGNGLWQALNAASVQSGIHITNATLTGAIVAGNGAGLTNSGGVGFQSGSANLTNWAALATNLLGTAAQSNANQFQQTNFQLTLLSTNNGVNLTNIQFINVATNLPDNTTFHLTGNVTGDYANPPLIIENTNTSSTCGPALRVVADGSSTAFGALSVSSQNTSSSSVIADFGNAEAFVCAISNNGSIWCSNAVYANGVKLTSDRNAKENFAAVDAAAMLDKVVALPISEWNYKTDPTEIKHLGPMAQDFQAAFGLDGDDNKHISVVDEGGVALAAIQGLNQKLVGLNQQIAGKDALIQKQAAEVADLKTRLEKIEKLLGK